MRAARLLAVGLIVLLLSGCSAAAAPREKARGRGEEERKAEGWSWRVNSDSDLRLVALLNGKRVYSFRIGAGGAIGAMDEETGQTPRPLLSPSAHGEHTDRIIQWTVWCQDIVSDVADLSETGRRFNMTQGGDQDGAFSAIRDVEVADGGGRIDVYAVAQDQWKPQQRKVIHCKLSALTRYEPLPNGVLKITRFIRVGTVTLRGKEVGFTRLYVEAWTPFLRGADDFNAVATLLGPGGEPSAVLHAGKDFPHYPNLDAQTTSGYAVAFNARRPAERDAVGVVFGGKPAEPREAGNISLFNLMQWDDGIGVLPGVVFGSAEAGSVVEQSIYLVPRPGLHAEMRETVTALAAGAAAPRLWRPAELAGGELREIAARLEDNVDRPGTRTEHLRASIRKD